MAQPVINKDKTVFRKASLADVDVICGILRAAANRMLAEGKHQWDEYYPTRTHVISDIESGIGYVIECHGDIVAYGAVVTEGEPLYAEIIGAWLSDGEYIVVHRMAVSQRAERSGFGYMFLKSVEELAISQGIKSFRIDTNFDNERMLGLLEKFGFRYCGEVMYENGAKLAFEKLLA